MVEDFRKEWVLMVDGAARGNPGEAGCGAVIYDESGKLLRELCRYLGRATNNVAEYEGLLMGLEGALE
ncbi:MAG: reverse transcriptase-like protein, partial [Candidatus Binatia bacterium]